MNRTKIEYVNYTWNPVTGCTKGCEYCYASRLAQGRLRKMYNVLPGPLKGQNIISPKYLDPNGYGGNPAQPFAPRYWHDRILEPLELKKPQRIFVCNMGDLFDPYVPDAWIELVINTAKMCPRHTFLFLTKQPERMAQFEFPPNAWCGVTLDGTEKMGDVYLMMDNLYDTNVSIRFISYEPLLKSVCPPFWSRPWIKWVIVGGLTGFKQKTNPAHVQRILDAKPKSLPVFLKDNLKWREQRREFPKEQE